MKKLLAFLLVLVMLLSVTLVACNKRGSNNVSDDDDWGNGGTTTKPKDEDSNGEGEGEGEGDLPSYEFVNASGSVYAGVNGLRLRSEPSTSSQVVAQVNAGTKLTRTSTNTIWDKVTFGEGEDKQDAYVLCALVTAVKTDFTFSTLSEEDQVTLTIVGSNAINLRSTPFLPDGDYSFSNAEIQALKASNGTLKKIGVSTSGNWYKVSFTGTVNGKTFNGTEELYMAASSVTAGYVTDPSANSGDSGIG